MWLHYLLWGTSLLSWALGNAPISRHCGFLEYWDLKSRCCRRCLERFGPPSCPDYEFTRHCGLSDRGDHLHFPFAPCLAGFCNRNWAEQCTLCSDQSHPQSQSPSPPPAARDTRYQALCSQEPIPARSRCERKNITATTEPPSVSTVTSQPTSPPGSLSLGPAPTKGSDRPPTYPGPVEPFFTGNTVWYVVGISTLLVGGLLVSAVLQTLGRAKSKERAAEAEEAWKFFPLTERSVSCTLARQPLSRLLDELEVLEELVVLLDPEPGPCGGSAWGTTRHLAARYGLPATWATFAYSLRPAHSPLRALLETVTARDPTAQLGQLADHLSQLGRGDALGVLRKLR